MIKIIKKFDRVFILMIPFILLFIYSNTRLSMLYLHHGDYIGKLDSPNKEYTLKAYRHSGGMTVDWSVRVELVNNKTNKKKNIYYRYHDSKANMKWLNEDTVKINKVTLNIHKDYYHG